MLYDLMKCEVSVFSVFSGDNSWPEDSGELLGMESDNPAEKISSDNDDKIDWRDSLRGVEQYELDSEELWYSGELKM